MLILGAKHHLSSCFEISKIKTLNLLVSVVPVNYDSKCSLYPSKQVFLKATVTQEARVKKYKPRSTGNGHCFLLIKSWNLPLKDTVQAHTIHQLPSHFCRDWTTTSAVTTVRPKYVDKLENNYKKTIEIVSLLSHGQLTLTVDHS